MNDNTIHGPKGGIFGLKNILGFQKDPIGWLMNVAHSYGDDMVHWQFGPLYDVYMPIHPDYIHQILVKQANKSVKWERMAHTSTKASGQSLVVLEGDVWKKARKLTAPAFHTQRIKHYIELMERHTRSLMNKWEDGHVYEMGESMVEVTMGIIGEILFNIPNIEKDAAQLNESLLVLLDMFVLESSAIQPIPDWVPTPRNLRENKAMKVSDDYVMKIIEERRALGEDKGDVLSALLHAVDEEGGGGFNDEEVRDQLLGLFVAGHETTAVWMTWTLYLLAKHPEIQEKLFQQVSSVMQDDVPSLEDLETMTYTDAVLHESLRIYPPAWSLFVRQVTETLELGGHKIDVGKLVYISPWVVHHDARWWPNPSQFDPSRFEGDWKSQRPNFAYMPFGGGPRICVGSHLAEMEAEVILATLVKNFTFELSEPNQEAKPDPKFTVHPAGGMKLKVCRR